MIINGKAVTKVPVKGKLVSELFFVFDTILNPVIDGLSTSAVSYEIATCHHHFYEIIELLHGPKILCDAILDTLNGISVANLYSISGKVAIHLVAWHNGGPVAKLFCRRANAKSPSFLSSMRPFKTQKPESKTT